MGWNIVKTLKDITKMKINKRIRKKVVKRIIKRIQKQKVDLQDFTNVDPYKYFDLLYHWREKLKGLK